MESLLQDIRYGIRTLLHAPAFSAVAVLTLALGIGANTAMFSVIEAVLLRALPVRDEKQVMVVWQRDPNGQPNAFTVPNYDDWKQQDLLKEMGAFSPASFNLSVKEAPERVSGGRISHEVLNALGVAPVLGRGFSAIEDVPNGPAVVLLSNALWKTRFGGRQDILGSTVQLDGVPHVVIGVMPPAFRVINDTELAWTPLQLKPDPGRTTRSIHQLFAFLRLPPGMSIAQAQAGLERIAERLRKEDPNGDAGRGVVLQSIRDFTTGSVRNALLILMGCVTLVLLIACSNIANLLLARGASRLREISIRAALGASRVRLVRQLLTESIVLALLGGVAGLGIAALALKLLLAVRPTAVPHSQTIAINGVALAYTLGICLAAGIVFGMAPAIASSGADLERGLKPGSRGSSGAMSRNRAVTVVAETALACILVIAAGLALKSLWQLSAVSLGFNPDRVLSFRVAAPTRLPAGQVPEFYRQVLERMRGLPGVQSAAIARDIPMSGTDPSMSITIEGGTPAMQEGEIITRYRSIGPDYFRTLQIPIIRGRELNDGDTASAPGAVVVSESLARRYWPNQDAIGKRLKPNIADARWYTVVGVAGDVRHWSRDIVIEPTAYYPYTQIPTSFEPLIGRYITVVLRTTAADTGILPAVRNGLAELDKSVAIYTPRTLNQMVNDSGSLQRFDMLLLGTFAGLALLLAAVGTYGVVAYSVAQRTRELGIRIALGAGRLDVLRLILGEGARLGFAGVVVGVIGAAALTRLMASLLYQVRPRDLATFLSVPPVIFIVLLIACYIPARRASRVDPMLALRYE